MNSSKKNRSITSKYKNEEVVEQEEEFQAFERGNQELSLNKRHKPQEEALFTNEIENEMDIHDLSEIGSDQNCEENEVEEFETEEDNGFGNYFIKGPDPDSADELGGIQGNPSDTKILGFKDKNSAPDLALINMKIEELLKVLELASITFKILARFKEMREEERSRQSYIDELAENLCIYYGYNKELIELFLNIFNPSECVQFLEANEKPRPSTIRTNTLKTNRKYLAQILLQRGVNLEPLAEWSKVGIKIFESKVPIGATPEYLAGHYMLQSASSFLPVISLAPQTGERILDLAAAPGGKTTYISQLMKNTGIVVANDAKNERLKALKFNLQRLGITNCIVCNYDGRKFPKVMKGFDRVLLDAPCTGLGIIAKDQSIKSQRLYIDVKKMSHLQKELILAAIDCCKPGGYIVYSTCSITVEENEWVVDYAIKNRHVKIVDSGLEIGEEGFTKYQNKRFHPSLKLSRRIYPHTHNMDGFFITKIKKIENGRIINETSLKTQQDIKIAEYSAVMSLNQELQTSHAKEKGSKGTINVKRKSTQNIDEEIRNNHPSNSIPLKMHKKKGLKKNNK